ncbi:MAG: carboxymuconolactone decarboxylase family protein [Candidatus Lokiarchaeota archaeon]|nr:carboxymuconolactone decarboxylase family protein [Candidatus Lokiarchaeota archaeon]
MKDSEKKLIDIRNTLKEIGKVDMNSVRKFRDFMNSVKVEGALSTKIKELIGVAVSISRHCEFCVPLHVKQALEHGATKEEIIEASMIAGLLGGGPSVIFIKYVFDALNTFQK